MGFAFRHALAGHAERYGKYKSVHERFTRWAAAGVWDRVFADLLKDGENRYVMIDPSVVRAHQQAATAQKKRLRGALWGGIEEV